MPIPLSCACGRTLRVKDELAGRRVKCPTCGETLTVPTPEPAADEGEPGRPPQNDPWKEAPSCARDAQPDSANVEEIGEVLPVDSDEDAEERDDDELSLREKVRRKEERAAEREAEREAERKAKGRKKRRNEKRNRELVEKGRFRIHGSGRGPVERGADPPRERWLYNINAGIGGGVAMIVLSLVCSGLALKARGVFFVTPVLLIVGIVAVIKGVLNNRN